MEFSKIVKKTKKGESQAVFPEPPVRRVVPPLPPAPEPLLNEEEEKAWKEPEIKPVRPLFTTAKTQRFGQEHPERRAEVSPPPRVEEPGLAEESFEPARPVFSEDTTLLYDKMIGIAQRIFAPGVVYEEIDTTQVVGAIAEVASAVAAGDEKLTEMAITRIQDDQNSYLNQHSVNVCVLSLVIGFGLDYEMGRLIELGLAAFFHDIGMTCYEDMARSPRRLSPKEFEEIKKHVEAGDAILKKVQHGLGDTIRTVQFEIHERLDGSGYPLGKKSVHDYARIVALADAFESMIHPRPFRQSFSIMEVYKRIFDAKNKYDQKVIKVLADRIGFFPNGSYVELNTKEVGKVLRQNARSPLRPFVVVLYGVDGERLDESKVKEVNLLKFPTIHVKKCFLEHDREASRSQDE